MKWVIGCLIGCLIGIAQARTGSESIPIAKELIQGYEGYRQCAYLPTPNDRYTYGFGSTFKPDGEPVRRGDCISRSDAEAILTAEIIHLERLVTNDVAPVKLNRKWRAALSSFVYNIGFGAYNRSTLRKHLQAKNWNGVCVEIVKWNKQAGKELKGLTRRRTAESTLMGCK